MESVLKKKRNHGNKREQNKMWFKNKKIELNWKKN